MKASRLKLLVGLVFVFAGLDVMILLSHLNRLFGVLFFVIGIGMLAWAFRGAELEESKPEETLAGKLIHLLTWKGRLKDLLPVAGAALVVLVFVYNVYVGGALQLGSNDYVTLLLGAVLVAYNYLPGKYAPERDFALLFFVFLFAILVIPTTLYELNYGKLTEANTDTPWTYYLLTLPTSGMLHLFGVENWIDPAHHNIINYFGPDGFQQAVSIGLSCTGLYSVSIFISAFGAFVAVEYRKFDLTVGLLLVVGTVVAWFANVIRMAIIVDVGHAYGPDALQWTHNNLGIIIFMIWVLLFWGIMFKVLNVGGDVQIGGKRRCAACGRVIAGDRFLECQCGRRYHRKCADASCPSCGGELAEGAPDSAPAPPKSP